MLSSFRRPAASPARVVFDKFHIQRHLSDALDQVRWDEYKRLQSKDRSYIKGQRHTLLIHRDNLSLDGCQVLTKLLAANKRVNTVYLLKESFGQFLSCRTKRDACAFLERWKQLLRWQRLGPYQKFERMIERHWDGIATYSRPDNKVSLGLVEGLTNKIRVIQRSAYGYRDEVYLKLKIIANFLPALPENAHLHSHWSAKIQRFQPTSATAQLPARCPAERQNVAVAFGFDFRLVPNQRVDHP